MRIKISSADEFENLLNALCDETVNACIHYRLYTDFEEARHEYATAFHQSWTFWSLTFQSHWDTTLFRLCKIYDQHSTSLNLRNLLDTIEENIGIFDVENYRERLKGNAFVDSLASGAKRPDIAKLKKDREAVCDSDPKVKALVFWRNNFFAHRSAKHAAEKRNLADHYTFDTSDGSGVRSCNTINLMSRPLDMARPLPLPFPHALQMNLFLFVTFPFSAIGCGVILVIEMARFRLGSRGFAWRVPKGATFVLEAKGPKTISTQLGQI